MSGGDASSDQRLYAPTDLGRRWYEDGSAARPRDEDHNIAGEVLNFMLIGPPEGAPVTAAEVAAALREMIECCKKYEKYETDPETASLRYLNRLRARAADTIERTLAHMVAHQFIAPVARRDNDPVVDDLAWRVQHVPI